MDNSDDQVHWRLLFTPPLDGPRNMALDHGLMARARASGEAVLRVYSWSGAVLSLGRNQRAVGMYDLTAMQRRKIDVVRRPTGGRALLHYREVTYSVTAPASQSDLSQSYAHINLLIMNALIALGVPATPAVVERRTPPPNGLPCFAEPARGEIVVNGRKLVGSAQWRDDGALLQHGSIIVDDDQASIPSLMLEPTPTVPTATLRDLLPNVPTPREVADALFAAVRSSADPAATILDENDLARLDVEPLVTFYRDPVWTWRR